MGIEPTSSALQADAIDQMTSSPRTPDDARARRGSHANVYAVGHGMAARAGIEPASRAFAGWLTATCLATRLPCNEAPGRTRTDSPLCTRQRGAPSRGGVKQLAGDEGIEPPPPRSERGVLPLDDSPIFLRHDSNVHAPLQRRAACH